MAPPRTRVVVGVTLGFAAGVAATLAAQAVYAREGVIRHYWDTLVNPPLTPTKVLFVVATLLALAALPFSILDMLATRRYRRAERRLRDERPADDVRPYEGPEGHGLLFEGAEGSVLLLEPVGGFGHPRLVERAPAPADEEGPPAPPDEAAAAPTSSGAT